jgi:hypothetical protein
VYIEMVARNGIAVCSFYADDGTRWHAIDSPKVMLPTVSSRVTFHEGATGSVVVTAAGMSAAEDGWRFDLAILATFDDASSYHLVWEGFDLTVAAPTQRATWP